MTSNPLLYVRKCGFAVEFSDDKLQITAPTTAVSRAVQTKVRRYVTQHKAEILSDLASEEAEARWQAGSRRR